MLGFRFKIRGEINTIAATITHPRAIGRVKKIEKLPLDIINDCRRVFSNKGPRMNARIKGAPSYSNFLKKYPTPPNMTMIITSVRELLML